MNLFRHPGHGNLGGTRSHTAGGPWQRPRRTRSGLRKRRAEKGSVKKRLAAFGIAAAGAGVLTVTPASAASTAAGLDPAKLQAAMDGVHRAGMPGLYAQVRDGGRVWHGASGVADVRTGRPVTPHMRQRVGSITKTFTAAAVLQQAERGRIRLDDPIGRYLPHLVPGERGRRITVRMLLNHTSGIADYIPYAFPSLLQGSPRSLEDNRFRRFRPAELIRMGLAAPATGRPGELPGSYSNTNYVILGQLLERVTGTPAEKHITRNVIERAGLKHTAFPAGPRIKGPHPRMYEAMYGLIDPPRDYSVYDMSWVGTAGAVVSTMDDLNRFYAALLNGKIISRASLAQMQRTVPVGVGGGTMDYGLGLYAVHTPCGVFWGHDGVVWGAGAQSLIRADGGRQVSYAVNLTKYNRPDSSGNLQPHPIDEAFGPFLQLALCGDRQAQVTFARRPVTPMPLMGVPALR